MAKKQNKANETGMSERDELSDSLSAALNKVFKNQKIAYSLYDLDAPTNVSDWISTGCDMLDLAISNRPNGGIPVGRITEITGLEQSGKSLLSYHLLAETQKKGGVAVLIDTETAVDNPFLTAIGVNLNDLVYVNVMTVEEIFSVIEAIISKIREKAPDRLVTVVVDSVAAATTELEQSADYTKDGWSTGKAIILSKAMRKVTNMIGRQKITLVFTNQLRMKLNAMFGDPYTTSGGKALQFHSSVRLRLKKKGKLKVKTEMGDSIVGITTQAVIIKNRMGPPETTVEFDILFNSGVDNYGSWFNALKKANLISGKGWYVYEVTNIDTGEVEREWKFQMKDFVKTLETDKPLRDNIYNRICNAVIMDYIKREESIINGEIQQERDEDE